MRGGGAGAFRRWSLLASACAASLPEAQGSSGAQPPEAPADDTENRGITIAVDPETNSLIVIGSPRAAARVADLAAQVQQQIPAAPGTVRQIQLPPTLDARSLAQLVNQTLGQMTPMGGNRGDYRRQIALFADAATNTLVVICNEQNFQTVGELVAAFSRAPVTEQTVVKIYPLQTVTVERALSSVRALMSDDGRDRQAQRMRQLAVTLLADDQRIEAVFDPSTLRISSDAQANALIAMGSAPAIAFLDRFVEVLDQTPVNVQSTLKLYPLEHARASELQNTLRQIFSARFRALRQRPGMVEVQPEFTADQRTNTLLVTASPETWSEVERLLRAARSTARRRAAAAADHRAQRRRSASRGAAARTGRGRRRSAASELDHAGARRPRRRAAGAGDAGGDGRDRIGPAGDRPRHDAAVRSANGGSGAG